jgi:arylsulfatase A-like enzyme
MTAKQIIAFTCLGLITIGFAQSAKKASKPNILFCIMDDASPYMSAYGTKWVKTPAFDRLAQKGVLFTNAYTPNAKCAPSRANVLTGRNSWQLEEGANHGNYFPTKYSTFPEVLQANGYATGLTGKGWGPGKALMANGKPRQLIGKEWNEIKMKPWANGMGNEDYTANFNAFLGSQKEGKPWFFWFGAREPHRKYEYQSGAKIGHKKLSDIDVVPAFWPDNEIVRNDMLDYALEVEYVDAHLEKMLASLEKRGLLENTIVVMTSDHGMPFPRCKAQEYEYSNHVPLAIMWPKGIKKQGRTVKDMVSFIDFAPTFLELAGIPIEKSGIKSPGTSLSDILYSSKSGQVNPKRDIIVIGKERHDFSRPKNQGYPIRGIVSDDFLYLYNYDISLWPAGNPEIGYLDIDGSPTKTEILRQFRTGENDFYWKLSMGKRTSNEEFFNLNKDAFCMNNLATNSEFSQKKQKMKARMESILKAQNDPRMFGNGNIFNTYPFSEESAWNYYERFMSGEVSIKNTGWVNPGDEEKEPID